MEQQNYSNHVRYYPPHHFIFYPVVTALLVLGIKGIIQHPEERLTWIMITALVFLVGWLSFMMRQHYALTLQNRLVKVELRLRYFQLTGQRLEPLEQHLSFGQLAALRFASDEELPALTERAIQDNMTPREIKRAIRNWHPDLMRV